MKRIHWLKRMLFIVTILVMSCESSETSTDIGMKDPVRYVNPYMGNISHLLVPTFPTIHLPNSMLRVYPQREDFTGDMLKGLPIILTSHRGRFAFNLSPYQGEKDGLAPVISYRYDQEQLTPYSYSVYLEDQQIGVDFGLSHQSAAYKFEFKKNDSTYLIINSADGEIKWNGTAVSGYQVLKNNVKVYLYLQPELAATEVGFLTREGLIKGTTAQGKNACLVLNYPAGTKELNVRYGISYIDEEQARKNMQRETTGKSIAELREEGRQVWNEALSRIRISGGTEDDKTVFYTSLYRCYERPVCISEDGRYFSGFDQKVHDDQGRPFYTDDWIWDTYRAHHPLRNLIDPHMESDILNSFVQMTEQMEHKWWPTFPEITGDRRAMNCNHGVASVLDAWRKGVRNFDIEKAYIACKAALLEKTLAPWSAKPAGELDRFYRENGYFPALKEGEKETVSEVDPFEKRQAVAVTLGTSYDDWCLGELANELGRKEDAAYFKKASFNYRNLFHPETHFFHPKDREGNFIEPFDYVFSGGFGARDYYGENNGWIYRWDVQHNIPDLIELMGGNETFVRNLDAMFSEPLGTSKFNFLMHLPDHSGNVGQFSMGNEPSLHIPYLYNYAGQPSKTQKRIRMLVKTWFRNDLMGVPGDEDGGGLSAFVVFSQMGFYPVTPGLPLYTIGSPAFEKITVDLVHLNGKTFTVVAKNNSETNKYIQRATLNGKILETPWITHEQILSGGTLELEMGSQINDFWAGADFDSVTKINNFKE